MTLRARLIRSSLLVPALLAFGCANAFLKGGTMAERDYAKTAQASYRMNGCTQVADNAAIAVPTRTYHLVDVDGKPALFERDDQGKGVVIDNTWKDTAGEHYYVGVTSNGWEYVLPPGGASGTRLVYSSVRAERATDGTLRPTSQPTARCELVALAR